jgi:PAS domain S-box-containing protein
MREIDHLDQLELSEAEASLVQLASVFFPSDAASPSGADDEPEMPLAEARYQMLLDQMTAVVFMVALDKGIGEAYVSPQIEAMLGFTRAEWLEEPIRWYRQVHPEDKERWSIEAAQFFLTGEPLRSVYRVIARDGRVVWFQCEAKMVRRKDGRPWFIHGVGFDVTDIKVAQQSLEASLEAAQAAVRTRNEFLANMSHEIRTPINGIMGMTQLALDTELTPEQTAYLRTVSGSADSLLEIVNDILDFSKIESHKLELENVEFDPLQCIEEAMRQLATRAREKGLEITSQIVSRLPKRLLGDAHRLRQVLAQVVGNAIKFTQVGEVALRVEEEAGPPDQVRLHLQVRDTGIGISREKRETIFAPFYQADGSLTRKHGGTGLGLTIASRLVQLMGGRIWVDSELGAGSTFHFTVGFGAAAAPTEEVGAGAAATKAQEQAVVQAGTPLVLRILVVEDNPVNRKVAVGLLQKRGHLVQTAENGLEALQALETGPFDVVLMDIQMPEMDGLQATTAIRELERGSGVHLPIVAMTAHAMKGDREICLAAGMDAYLTKPIMPKDLFAALHDVIPMPAQGPTANGGPPHASGKLC